MCMHVHVHMHTHAQGAGRGPQALQRARVARLRHRAPGVPALRRRVGGHLAGKLLGLG